MNQATPSNPPSARTTSPLAALRRLRAIHDGLVAMAHDLARYSPADRADFGYARGKVWEAMEAIYGRLDRQDRATADRERLMGA